MLGKNSLSLQSFSSEPMEELWALLNADMNCPPHEVERELRQPFSLGRRELEFLSPLLGERARVRAAKDSGKKIIFLFSNAELWIAQKLSDQVCHFRRVVLRQSVIGVGKND